MEEHGVVIGGRRGKEEQNGDFEKASEIEAEGEKETETSPCQP